MSGPRRGRGEGSVFFHTGKQRWAATITVGYSATGQRRRRSIYAPTKAALLERLQALRQSAAAGTLPEPNRMTLAAFLDRWLPTAGYRPSTRANCDSLIKKHILPHLGGVAVSQLTPMAIQAMLTTLKTAGVGAATRKKVYDLLHRSLRDAVAWRLVTRHPSEGIASPKYNPPAITPFTAEEVAQFFAAARTDRLSAFYAVLATTGMRLGETMGMAWSSIDLDKGTATVTRQLSEVRGKLSITDPKTPRARREIQLTRLAIEALREHRKRQLAAGHYRADGLVFTDTDGKPLRRSNLRRRSYYPLLEKAKLPRRTLHSLRHGLATMLLCDRVPVQVVSAILGHSRPSITLNFYAAYLPSMGKEAAVRLDRILSRTANGQPDYNGGHQGTAADTQKVAFGAGFGHQRTTADGR